MPEEKKNKFCSNCGAEIDIKAKVCPKCGVEQPLIPEKVSNWWYVLAIFLGIIGGIIAWAVNKDRNPRKAIRFLIVGIIVPIIIWIIYIAVLAPIVLVNVGSTKNKAKDASIMANISQIRVAAEIIYFDEGDNYSKVNCTHPEIASICQNIKAQIGTEPTIHSTQKEYCVYAKLLSGDYYCTNSSTRLRKTSTYPGGAGYCDGRTFICP